MGGRWSVAAGLGTWSRVGTQGSRVFLRSASGGGATDGSQYGLQPPCGTVYLRSFPHGCRVGRKAEKGGETDGVGVSSLEGSHCVGMPPSEAWGPTGV